MNRGRRTRVPARQGGSTGNKNPVITPTELDILRYICSVWFGLLLATGRRQVANGANGRTRLQDERQAALESEDVTGNGLNDRS